MGEVKGSMLVGGDFIFKAGERVSIFKCKEKGKKKKKK